MAKIFGKGTYRCCCGTGSNVPCFNVTASSEKEALYYLPDVCSSYGGEGRLLLKEKVVCLSYSSLYQARGRVRKTHCFHT